MTDNTRFDFIDGLRGIAVLAVMLFHLDTLVPYGYLGVDVFFVISGFVISRSIYLDTINGTYSYKKFLLKRARRLFPAFLLMLFTINIAAYIIIGDSYFLVQYFYSSLSSFFYLSNYYFWSEAGYFSPVSETIPLLHTWSLSVEMQFYLAFPFFFLLCLSLSYKLKKFVASSLIVTAFFILFVVTQYFAITHPSFAFYMPFTRAWQLLSGFIVFFFVRLGQNTPFTNKKLNVVLFCGALTIMAVIFFFELGHLEVNRVLAVFSVCIVIMSGMSVESPARLLTARPLMLVGIGSYSLYLWHSPILALYRYVFLDNPHGIALIVLVIVTGFVSYISFLLAEKYNRKILSVRPLVFYLYLACVGFSFMLPMSSILSDSFKIDPLEYSWSGVECQGSNYFTSDIKINECLQRSSNKKTIYVLGDSHATQLKIGLSNALDKNAYSVVSANTESKHHFPYVYLSEGAVNDDIIIKNVVSQAKSDDVVIITFHRGRLNKYRDDYVVKKDGVPNIKSLHFNAGFGDVLASLSAKVESIYLVLDTPMLNPYYDLSRCFNEYVLKSCESNIDMDRVSRNAQEVLFSKMARNYNNVFVIDPFEHFYIDNKFLPFHQGKLLMFDSHHLTEYGANRLALSYLARFVK
ncbi:acyltransferase [Gammaproteobacteria bacterium]|nr:acyltransferase [Gammaproteobacteria bacterium]